MQSRPRPSFGSLCSAAMLSTLLRGYSCIVHTTPSFRNICATCPWSPLHFPRQSGRCECASSRTCQRASAQPGKRANMQTCERSVVCRCQRTFVCHVDDSAQLLGRTTLRRPCAITSEIARCGGLFIPMGAGRNFRFQGCFFVISSLPPPPCFAPGETWRHGVIAWC